MWLCRAREEARCQDRICTPRRLDEPTIQVIQVYLAYYLINTKKWMRGLRNIYTEKEKQYNQKESETSSLHHSSPSKTSFCLITHRWRRKAIAHRCEDGKRRLQTTRWKRSNRYKVLTRFTSKFAYVEFGKEWYLYLCTLEQLSSSLWPWTTNRITELGIPRGRGRTKESWRRKEVYSLSRSAEVEEVWGSLRRGKKMWSFR